MLLIILLMTFVIIMLLALVACETYAMSYPKDSFSKWWRNNIMQIEKENKND